MIEEDRTELQRVAAEIRDEISLWQGAYSELKAKARTSWDVSPAMYVRRHGWELIDNETRNSLAYDLELSASYLQGGLVGDRDPDIALIMAAKTQLIRVREEILESRPGGCPGQFEEAVRLCVNNAKGAWYRCINGLIQQSPMVSSL